MAEKKTADQVKRPLRNEEIKNVFKAAVVKAKTFEKKMIRQGCVSGSGSLC